MATTYTPKVWQNWPSTATLFEAPDANRWEQAFADLYSQLTALAGAADPSREFAPENFGAAGNGTTIDRAAVQAAIDAANSRYTTTGVRQTVPITGAYLLDAVDYLKADGTVFGAMSLMLKDGVTLTGTGTLKVKNGAYGPGALYAVIRSASTGVSYAAVRNVTVDGNKAAFGASQQCSNIILNALTDVEVTGVRSINANGCGIQVVGSTTTAMTDVRITNNKVTGSAYIGIQSGQFKGLEIDGNTITDCNGNGIDIYGNNGTSGVSTGTDFRISNNRVRHATVGIFLETVATGVVTGNHVGDCTQIAATVNRIYGQPKDINIVANTFVNNPLGVRITGDTNGISIRNNVIAGVTVCGVQLGGGGGNVSQTFVLDNTIDSATVNTVPLVSVQGNQAAFNRHRGTITRNTDRTKDLSNTATTSVGNVFSAANAA